MDSGFFQNIFLAAVEELETHAEELSALDAETGDGDHGLAILRIAETIREESRRPVRPQVQTYFDDLCLALLELNTGSAGNLWGVMMEGIGAALASAPVEPAACTICMLRGARSGIEEISAAKPGEKTLVDALVPALRTAEQFPMQDLAAYLDAVAEAAWSGAAATEQMTARYGRAKNLLERSRGHRDPGAVSLALMIRGLVRAAKEAVV